MDLTGDEQSQMKENDANISQGNNTNNKTVCFLMYAVAYANFEQMTKILWMKRAKIG